MRRKRTTEEIAQYLRRTTALEKHLVLPARLVVILSALVSLWPVIGSRLQLRELALLRWAILSYAGVSIAYWVYLFRFGTQVNRVSLTKKVVFASALTDNVLLGVLLYAVMSGPLGEESVGTTPQASLFWVYCALIVRNTLLFQGPVLQILLNAIYILGYISAPVFNISAASRSVLMAPERRELALRIVVLGLITICSAAIYSILQRRRREMEDAHERALRSQRLDLAAMLAGQVAHELKNPLSVMTNAAYLLRRAKSPLDPDASRQLQIIQGEIHRADHIVNELLNYAHLAEGKIEGVLVNDAIDESIAFLTHELEARQILVERLYSFDLPFLFIDRPQLRQVFTNIVLNAAQAIGTRGKIVVRTEYSGNGFIDVSISDTGKGIPSDVLRNIFKPFFTTKENGTGVGLSIVQNTIKAYGGRVHVDTKVGEGTTFHLRFPTRLGQTRRPVAAPPEPHTQMNTATEGAGG